MARCGNYRDKGYSYTGALRILQVILSYDYLWIQVRVKGGAYGVMSGFGKTGDSYFVSYRDPNLGKTNEVFEEVPGYLRNFTADERDMTKYIIGTISSMDTPLTPYIRGIRNLSMYLSGVTAEMLQKERDEVLGASENDIRALADIAQAVLDSGDICAIGGAGKIEAEKELFKETLPSLRRNSVRKSRRSQGFVALIGRPNVGKSTLMNHLIGQKIAITSDKPQTTRNRIQTVYTDERGQIIFLDTPGIHKAKNKLGEYMVSVAERTLKDGGCDPVAGGADHLYRRRRAAYPGNAEAGEDTGDPGDQQDRHGG